MAKAFDCEQCPMCAQYKLINIHKLYAHL